MMNYDDICRRLARVYDLREARAIARLVLEERFSLTLADILCGKVTQLSSDDHEELEKIVCRLETSEPVQYVLGQSTFRGRPFRVAPGVLIPRPETAELCQWIVETVRSERCIKSATEVPAGLDILDIGTGSGCIAVSLALDIDDARVTAIDVSSEALAVARDNARSLGARVLFRQLDILASAPDRKYDIVVSNPPYVCRSEAESIEENVLLYEPDVALFVPDDDPLLFYRAIASQSGTLLSAGGQLFFEINPLFHTQVCELLRSEGFTSIESRRDQFGRWRFVSGRKDA